LLRADKLTQPFQDKFQQKSKKKDAESQTKIEMEKARIV
jgi:hypothetical protein